MVFWSAFFWCPARFFWFNESGFQLKFSWGVFYGSLSSIYSSTPTDDTGQLYFCLGEISCFSFPCFNLMPERLANYGGVGKHFTVNRHVGLVSQVAHRASL